MSGSCVKTEFLMRQFYKMRYALFNTFKKTINVLPLLWITRVDYNIWDTFYPFTVYCMWQFKNS